MRLHIPSCLLLLAICCDVEASDLYTTINLLRDGEENCDVAKHLPPLKPNAELESVAKALARGNKLEQSLMLAGYRATRVSALRFRGNGIDREVADMLAKRNYCQQLQDPAITEIGIYLDPQEVWIVLAARFSPLADMDEQSAAELVLDLVNEARATRRSCGKKTFNAAPPLRWNPLLADASRLHSEDMARFSYFSHKGRDGSTPPQRVERAGYRYRITGENIAGGQMTPEDAVAGWIDSPRHCANLMNPAFTEMGVAVAVDRKSKLGVYWTQEFGTLR